jgi:4-hydroxybenzoate polyprenyltransferase
MEKYPKLILGFISLCLVASSIYILNDHRDIEADRLHPRKCRRPLAAGAVSTGQAFLMMGICFVAGMIIAWSLGITFFLLMLFYFAMNVAYSMGLKNVAVLDILMVALGFSLRIKMGGELSDLPITTWLNIMVFLLALFISIGKRYDDLYIHADSGLQIRRSMTGYSVELLNIYLAMVSGVIIVSYILYTISPDIQSRFGTYRLYYTTLFVIAGLLRYLQIVYVRKESGSPTRVLYKDLFLQVCILLWIISFYAIIYAHLPLFG